MRFSDTANFFKNIFHNSMQRHMHCTMHCRMNRTCNASCNACVTCKRAHAVHAASVAHRMRSGCLACYAIECQLQVNMHKVTHCVTITE